jgi:hypothetical protein
LPSLLPLMLIIKLIVARHGDVYEDK